MSETKCISSVKFLYLSPEEIRKLSAVEVTETEIFAQIQSAPIPGGLYDLRMGPVERGDTCKTCSLQAECPGHLGHIELACDIYNPFLMRQLYSLVKKCCTRCFRFRLNGTVTSKFVDKFRLLSRGHEIDMSDIPLKMIDESKKAAIEKDSLIVGGAIQTMHWTDASIDKQWTEEFDETSTHSEKKMKNLRDSCSEMQRRRHFESMKTMTKDPLVSQDGGMGSKITTGEIGSWSRLVSEFLSLIPSSTCENCGMASNTFRIDGYSRIFMKPRNSSKDDEKYLTPAFVKANLISLLWPNEAPILKYVFPGAGDQRHNVFFLKNVVVPPNRFRPLRVGGSGGEFLPANTQALKSIIIASEAVKAVIGDDEEQDGPGELGTALIALQDRVNGYMDSTKSGRTVAASDVQQGVRQLLERKQGLFRMKMMGKRVNYACRSVISPDINLETNQIGLPRFAAMQLSVPEPVCAHNLDYLRVLVQNGPDVYPGATAIEFPDGKIVSLVGRSDKQRESLANALYVRSTDGKGGRIVMRHVRNGDPLLVNRQPTLHKPGIMAMLVRILHSEKTIRMHYVNCNTFNADFDGDEINLHCPQDFVARAEALFIANADTQFLGPTAGNPLRGLIQDSVASAAFLTGRGTFLDLDQVHQLLYAGLRAAIEGDTIVSSADPAPVSCHRDLFIKKGNIVVRGGSIEVIAPAVLKPVPLWTGKQVMSMVIRSLVKFAKPNIELGLNHVGKSRTPGDLWGGSLDGNKEEEQILIRDSELLMGVIDKNSIGANAGGLSHVFYELLGPAAAGLLLTGVSRMFALFLQTRGLSCAMRDILITPEAEQIRGKLLDAARQGGWAKMQTWVADRRHLVATAPEVPTLRAELGAIVKSKSSTFGDLEMLEKMMLGNSSEFWGKTIDSVLPAGLVVPFPQNNFSAMVMTGAKGSKINQSQISCLLGQQELEGHRVPLMCTMKSLPSFAEFDLSSRAGGFVADRFLTGVRPQEFFFHCMAGREGLIDTAVKTARSGYLQRCLVKHMEGLVVQYDHTVRDSDASIVQFLYGEDGLDILKSSYLKIPQVFKSNTHFLPENLQPTETSIAMSYIHWLRKRTSARRSEDLLALVNASTDLSENEKEFIRLTVKRGDADPIEHILSPMRFEGAVSNRHMTLVADMLTGKGNLFSKKFQASMADPGECVGTLAAQGMGEPSTQMTLNTFHLAGHGGANVTLGIPRLREIVQTASRKIATPSMFVPLKTVQEAEALDSVLTRISLHDIVTSSQVEESVYCLPSGEKKRKYILKIGLVNLENLNRAYPQLTIDRVRNFLQNDFATKLDRDVRNFLRVSMQMQSQKQINDDTGLRVGARAATGRDEDEEEVSEETVKKDTKKVLVVGERVRKTEAEDEEEGADDEDDAGGQYDDEDEVKAVAEEAKDSDDEEEKASTVLAAAPVIVKDANAIFGSIGSLGKIASGEYEFVIESRDLILADKKVSRKILILEVVEDLCATMFVQQTLGITKVHVTNTADKVGITTEGSNLEFAWGLDGVDHDKLYTNDICKVLDTYGVEACRQSIIKEIQNVFNHYGISVDFRHLSLIADYMTHQGGYRPFNRGGIANHSSPILKMSFETSMNFLSAACHDIQVDSLKSAAAAIVVGKLVPVGTGVFDIIKDTDATDIGTVGYRKHVAPVETPSGHKRWNAHEELSTSKRTKKFTFD